MPSENWWWEGWGVGGVVRGKWCVYNAFSNSPLLDGRRKKEIMWWIGSRVECDCWDRLLSCSKWTYALDNQYVLKCKEAAFKSKLSFFQIFLLKGVPSLSNLKYKLISWKHTERQKFPFLEGKAVSNAKIIWCNRLGRLNVFFSDSETSRKDKRSSCLWQNYMQKVIWTLQSLQSQFLLLQNTPFSDSI